MNSDSKPNLEIAPDTQACAYECASCIVDLLKDALTSGARATLAVSGGNTPTPMFENLAKSNLDWSKIHIFWVDERCVPPDDSRSNFRGANNALLKPASVPEPNIHRIRGEEDPEEAARKYVSEIKEFFSLAPGELPVFDVLHRGMGPDAHTASLFPGEPLINNQTDIAAHVWVEKMKMHRVTLLPGVLLKAAKTVLQVVGTDKADALNDVLYGPEDPLRFPCQLAVRNSSRAAWFLDEEAAVKVQKQLSA